ncbi:hypothetical protein JM18_003582 [Phytophthora kernoviae]|uniref:Expansin-like EG45 domain-containing protein n=2 Tax=Phytophthora kernoviae TaxID=325452 RepID=A0A922ALE3_9STRA|nr:hypothetical protein G195_004827 [Phytophthora kernoviae 00238/432]KAG2525137.1 hypothetical protein JM18_003582 [Phytophthora kernoviae]
MVTGLYLRTAATLFVGAAALVAADEYFTGDGTSYTLSQVSSGNCNFMSASSTASTNYVALNQEQWDNLGNCGRCIEVSCIDDQCTAKNKTAVVQVLDRCPECKSGDLDLSPTVYKEITGLDPNRLKVRWRFVDCPDPGNVQVCLKEGSNANWIAIQPTNAAAGVKSVTVDGAATTMLEGAYYYVQSSASADLSAVKVSITSVSGDVIDGTYALTAGKCVDTEKQFGGGSTSQSSPSPAATPASPKVTTAAPTSTTAAPAATTATPSTTEPTQTQTGSSSASGEGVYSGSQNQDASASTSTETSTPEATTATPEATPTTPEATPATPEATPSTPEVTTATPTTDSPLDSLVACDSSSKFDPPSHFPIGLSIENYSTMVNALFFSALAAFGATVVSAEYYEGDGTSYTLGDVSSGNCNFMSAISTASTNYAALNNDQWDNLANCGRCAEVSCIDDQCEDQTTTAVVQILDRCPECSSGDLDLSPTVFKNITGSDPSRLSIRWRFVDCPSPGTIEVCLKSGSNGYYVAVQPTNTLVGVETVTINGESTTMVDSAYYYLITSTSDVDLTTVAVSITSVDGEVIEGTYSLTAGECTDTKKQFTSSGSSQTSSSTTTTTTTTVTPTTKAPTATTVAPSSTSLTQTESSTAQEADSSYQEDVETTTAPVSTTTTTTSTTAMPEATTATSTTSTSEATNAATATPEATPVATTIAPVTTTTVPATSSPKCRVRSRRNRN